MVSEFLLETVGRLKLLEEEIILNPNVPIEARKFLKPGKNEEGSGGSVYSAPVERRM